MTDIATHLGVSRLTVSAVMNNRTSEVGISDRTAERVRKAALELGYHRNHLAVAMKTGINQVVGCMVSGLMSEWTGRTLSGFLRNMHEANFLVKIEEVQGKEQERIALTRFIEQRVAGIFCCNFNPHKDFAHELESMAKIYQMPIIHAFSSRDLPGYVVDSNDRLGIELAVDHLWALGHRQIAYLETIHVPCKRRDAFLETMQERAGNLNGGDIYHKGEQIEDQEKAVEIILNKRGASAKTAIICPTDASAAIAIRVARRMGYSVPKDISVIGFGNTRFCLLTDPPLSSVEQAFEAVGQRCSERFIQLTVNRKAPFQLESSQPELIPTRLIVRESTAPAPNS